jgi:O-antigen/teichoic acid export membrane protein
MGIGQLIDKPDKKTGVFHKILKEAGIGLVGTVSASILNYILLAILTQNLVQEDYGTFTLAQSILNVTLTFVLFGTPKALARFVPFYNAVGDHGKTKTLIRSVFTIVLSVSVVVSIALILGAPYVARLFVSPSRLSSSLRIIFLCIPFLSIIHLVSFTFIGFKELKYRTYLRQITWPVLQIFLAILFFSIGYGLQGWLNMYVIAALGTGVLAIWFFWKRIVLQLRQVPSEPLSLGEVFSYSWPLSINMMVLTFAGQIDMIVLGVFRPTEEVGIFRNYLLLLVVLAVIRSSLGLIYKPIISEMISRDRIGELRQVYTRLSKWMFLANTLGFCFISLFGPRVIAILFGESYVVTPLAIPILAVGTFVNSGTGPTGMTLESFGNTKFVMLNSVVLSLTNLVLDFLLIPRYGVLGAAIGASGALVVVTAVELIENYFLHNLQPFTRSHLGAMGAGFGAATLVHFLMSCLPATHFALGIEIVLVVAIYGAGLIFFRCLDQTDYQLLREVIDRVLKR